MVRRCSVKSCRAKKSKDVRFFGVPSVVKHLGEDFMRLTTARRKLWLERLGMPSADLSISTHNICVCSNHFWSGQPAYEEYRFHDDWAPSLKLDVPAVKHSSTSVAPDDVKGLHLTCPVSGRILMPPANKFSRKDADDGEAEEENEARIGLICPITGLIITADDIPKESANNPNSTSPVQSQDTVSTTSVESIVNCCAPNCNRGRNSQQEQLFPVPEVVTHLGPEMKRRTERRRTTWLTNLCVSDQNDLLHVCSLHFLSGEPSDVMEEDSPDWAPTQNLFILPGTSAEPLMKTEREVTNLEAIRDHDYTTKQSDMMTTDEGPAGSFVECTTSMTVDEATQTDQQPVVKENFFHRCLSSKEWMAYYANVTPDGFRSLFNAMRPELKKQGPCSLPPEEQLFMVLVKLTLDLDDMDLAFRFGVTLTDVVRYLSTWTCAFRANRRLFYSFAAQPERRWKRGRIAYN